MTQVAPRTATPATGRPGYRPPAAPGQLLRQPGATDRLDEYQRLVAALAGAIARRDADLEAADRAYTTAVTRAEDEVAAAVVDTDAEADRLCGELRRNLGWRGGLRGDTPAPAEPDPGATAGRLLAAAGARIGALRPDRPRRPLPRAVAALLPVLGAAMAALAALVAGGLVTLGRGEAGVPGVLRGLGYLAFLLAPFAGLPAGAMLVDRRSGGRLDAGGIAGIVLGGMVAGSAVALALR